MTRGRHLVPGATKCQHVYMPARPTQRSFRLTEQRGKVWEDLLAEAGMKQQTALETLVDALGAGLIGLNDLRAQVIQHQRKQGESS